MTFVTHAPIAIEDLIARVSNSGVGGTAVFLGTVRRGEEDGPVAQIEYTGYEAMIEAEFGRIVEEAGQRWRGVLVAAVHRLGVVPVGEASIAIVTGTPHRDDAFASCRFVIEQAKQRLPVWKKEMFDDGSTSWREEKQN